ncbi:MAG: ribbon-helix-helix domain-containing protein [Alphaproteobacteria bacterium]|nr:ribbon-helix-helix domain-containing protein [Alphaproteobacteria bacterium]MBR2483003.1 ribbon-helix-helix domain-containing protein [Alphaproteobacteria bacterium]
MKKISVSLSGHQTSITLEPEFIDILTTAAKSQNTSVASIISSIDNTRAPDTNLSSAVRVWILNWVISHK